MTIINLAVVANSGTC